MSYKILETVETLNDLSAIAINAYNYTRYTSSGDNVLITIYSFMLMKQKGNNCITCFIS